MTAAIPAPRLERYMAALREADTQAQLTDPRDLERFASAMVAMADTELDPVYRSGYQTGRMHAGGGAATLTPCEPCKRGDCESCTSYACHRLTPSGRACSSPTPSSTHTGGAE